MEAGGHERSGAEPFSASGGVEGVLVLHGFTGSPQSVRGLAVEFASAGFTVELPLLPGHGGTFDDLAATGWADWSAAAEVALEEIWGRCQRVVVAGLSAGGTLAVWLAAHHPEVAGVVVVNPFIDPPAASFLEMLGGMRDAGGTSLPGIGGDVADRDQREVAAGQMPLISFLSLCEALVELAPQLGRITCPVLIFTSPQDHVVPPVSSEVLASAVRGPVERVSLPRSYHVATLDHDRHDLARAAVTFVEKLFGRGT